MTNDDYWNAIKFATEINGTLAVTFRQWKSRGAVPAAQALALYEALAGTPHEMPLEVLLSGPSCFHTPHSAADGDGTAGQNQPE